MKKHLSILNQITTYTQSCFVKNIFFSNPYKTYLKLITLVSNKKLTTDQNI